MISKSIVNKERQSQFELIRIVAQLFIIVYHIYLFFIYPVTAGPFHKAIWLPLHVGVILFILISGWFRIKASVKSFLRLIIMMAVLYFPLQILWICKTGFSSVFEMCTLPFFITWSPFWFMRTYVYLFLLAPVLNLWMDNSSCKGQLYLLIVLFLISHYVGSWGADASLSDGKNAITFAFIYVLGMMLREYRSKTESISTKLLATVYVGWNIVIVAVFSHPDMIPGYDFFYNRIFFSYCSIGLLINAVMLFLLLSRLNFKSRIVNVLGGASLTMYMVHSANIILYEFIGPIMSRLLKSSVHSGEVVLFLKVLCLTLLIMLGCVGIHYLLYPIAKRLSNNISGLINNKFHL